MEANVAYVIVAAFFGGVILNAMPCVLPVLTMKVYHVLENAKEEPGVTRRHAIAYAVGIMVPLLALAGLAIGLRSIGQNFNWGMQFQNPMFVAAITAALVAFGLNALGVFEITLGMGDVEAGGYSGSFINGIMAAVMSTPCAGPFFATAFAYSLHESSAWWQTLLVFSLMGAGLAAPFLLIAFVPAIGRKLPRPGPWMETFKMLMGFTLLGAAIWMFGTLQHQITIDGAQMFLAFLLVMSVALWGMQRFGGFEHSNLRRRLVMGGALLLTSVTGFFILDFAPRAAATESVAAEWPAVIDDKINWAPFSTTAVEASLKRGKPVFMDYTAEWCANCKSNEKLFIETPQIRTDLEATKILPMKADMTNENEVIEEWMENLGRSAIPIYVIYYPDGSRDLLPEVITTTMLSKALKKAAGKYPPEKFAPPSDTPAKSAQGSDKAKAAGENG